VQWRFVGRECQWMRLPSVEDHNSGGSLGSLVLIIFIDVPGVV